MSIRQMLHEFRPLFRMLDQPLTRSPVFGYNRSRSLFDDPFFQLESSAFLRPAVDVTEQGNKYILEADLPGVKKENLEVRIGDGGRSITIEGRLGTKLNGETPESGGATTATGANVPAETEGSSQLSVERPFASNATFTRTVYLPRPVDSDSVVAKLTDGVLKITVPKAEDKASVVVPISLE